MDHEFDVTCPLKPVQIQRKDRERKEEEDTPKAVQHGTDCQQATAGRGGAEPRPTDAGDVQEAWDQRADLLLLVDQAFDNSILKEVASGNF